jgi:hypothetical protein
MASRASESADPLGLTGQAGEPPPRIPRAGLPAAAARIAGP